MRHRRVARIRIVALLTALSVGTIICLSWAGVIPSRDGRPDTAPDHTSEERPPLMAIAPPPFSPGIFPCSDCHDGSYVDTTRRIVEEHDIIFEHDAENRWCLDCHDATNRDKLRLADGRLLDFTESHLLCGQCHGPTHRDWRHGAHGKRTGSWSGAKEYLLCVHCHDPHSPKFKPIEPMPPPVRPEMIR